MVQVANDQIQQYRALAEKLGDTLQANAAASQSAMVASTLKLQQLI